MARQLGVASRSLRRVVLLRQGAMRPQRSLRVFCSVSSSQLTSARPTTPSSSPAGVHQSLVTSSPNLLALQRVQQLLQQPQRRVLLLTANSSVESIVNAELERDTSVFELERRGHGVFSLREFCQLLLRESGRERRIFGRAQLAALLLYNLDALPSASRFAAVSTLQRRKRVQDLLQLFRLLEREGATPEQYAAVAGESRVAQELVEGYNMYQELLAQHNATSWDGLVMDVLAMCGVRKGEEPLSRGFSEGLLRQYTDVVVNDVHRMTPAMARLVGHFCAQPSVRSSASFSRVLLEGDDCPRTQILEQQLLETAERIDKKHAVNRIHLKPEGEAADKRVKMQAFAQQLLTSSASTNKGKKAIPAATVSSPVPLRCWRFGVSEAEEKGVGAFLAERLQREDASHITVLCPSYAEANRITMAFRKQGLAVRMDNDKFSVALSSTGAPIHLFDEPGVNAVYSLLCALCFPSDSRHLYNVLRSEFFAFPPELLSWLMEKDHRSHADLFQVLESFVESRGKTLFASLQDKDNEQQDPPRSVSLQLESGLETAEAFVALIKRLRTECHKLSAAEIVQSFLEETGRLEMLLSPNSQEQDRESIALADFLRELETAQNVASSAQVAFVVPYLQQLQETNLTSLASWEQSSPEFGSKGSKRNLEEASVRVLPLTAHALESLVSSVDTKTGNSKRVLVLMSMRDSKFPGRMKRLTLPLPLDILSEPFPVQTRAEHLEYCEQLAYQALTLGAYDEVVLSFAELTGTKREALSRSFQSIWHDGDRPAAVIKGGSKGKEGGGPTSVTTLSQNEPSSQAPVSHAAVKERSTRSPNQSHSWFAEVAEFVRGFVNRIIVPIWHHKKKLPAVVAAPRRDPVGTSQQKPDVAKIEQQETLSVNLGTTNTSKMKTLRSPVPATRAMPYKPPHLSYSQISEYLRCPHRYFLGRVMKLNGDVSTSMMFGRALHEGVAAFAKTIATAQRKGDVSEETKTLASVEAEEAFMRSWVGDGFGLFSSKEQAEFLVDRGMLALWDFINAHYDDLLLQEIVHVEQEFAFHVPEANVELRGVWDRIDRVDRGDGSPSFIVKEFKSNMGGAKRNMRKMADESLQLKMYMYAFRKVFGEAPYGAMLQQIGSSPIQPDVDFSKASIRRTSVKEALVLFSEEAAQEAEAAIVEVASGLRRGDFEPKPSFAECAFCPFAGSACHFATDSASHEARSARSTAV